jgi:hypothetical protein
VSESNCDDHTSGPDRALPSKRYGQAIAIRYRAHATELRELAKNGSLDTRRRRMLEIAAEFEQLAAGSEHSSSWRRYALFWCG